MDGRSLTPGFFRIDLFIFKTLGINVWSLLIEDNSLLSLNVWLRDILWKSNVFKDMYSERRIGGTLNIGKMSSHSCIVMMFDAEQMSFETVYKSTLGLTYMFNMANITFYAINKIIASTIPKCDGIVGSVVMIHFSSCHRL